MRKTRIREDGRVSGREGGILRANTGWELWKRRFGVVRGAMEVNGRFPRGRGRRVRSILGLCDCGRYSEEGKV